MKKIMLIGYGAMAQEVIAHLPQGISIGWIVARAGHHPSILAQFNQQTEPLLSPADCRERPDLVLECASQQAVAQLAAMVLQRGWTLAVISTGALADAQLEQHLITLRQQTGGRLRLLAGAVAGMDGLASAREGGLEQVVYQSRKSPASWRGSHAEKLVNLAQVSEARVFFHGSAREAARLFPANANVAATIALAGIGMDETEVQLMVDPATTRNTHRLYARGRFGEMQLELSGFPLGTNPKTSTLAALSAVQACRQLLEE
ncbi:aspartate dehydrogenase [Winslowiella toletana]|uniref:aspartate dehydrogenase n=1 Tax=Winslowiella toletana TaxID=92490 RepID=UPI0028BD718F|nr:aspartate dehydrogenase [Winslowiella toletana]WNN43621.1 aspartate dehydrogenase [Winslowiella toletana]